MQEIYIMYVVMHKMVGMIFRFLPNYLLTVFFDILRSIGQQPLYLLIK